MDGDSSTSALAVQARAQRLEAQAEARLERLGPQVLADEELVALVCGASDAGALLDAGLAALSRESMENVLEHPALRRGGGARLLAALELGRRAAVRGESRPRLVTPADVYAYAKAHLCGLRREEFHVLCLSSRQVLLRHARVAEGSVDQCCVDPREVLGPAVASRASGLVLLHNHPSGDPEPSAHDVALTRQLRDGARLLCINVLDHLVLSDRGFVSFTQRGLLDLDDARAWATRLQDEA
jgi:DNA repair protein RadC